MAIRLLVMQAGAMAGQSPAIDVYIIDKSSLSSL
jgi:hypothetical protein